MMASKAAHNSSLGMCIVGLRAALELAVTGDTWVLVSFEDLMFSACPVAAFCEASLKMWIPIFGQGNVVRGR